MTKPTVISSSTDFHCPCCGYVDIWTNNTTAGLKINGIQIGWCNQNSSFFDSNAEFVPVTTNDIIWAVGGGNFYPCKGHV